MRPYAPSAPVAAPRAIPPSRRIPTAILAAAAAVFVLFGVGPNLDLAALALGVFLVGWAILWRPGESGAIIVIFSLHWLASAMAIFQSNWLGVDIFYYTAYGGDMRAAAAVSLLGVLCLAIGMRIGAGAWRPDEAERARRIALSRSVKRWFFAYLAASAASIAALALISLVPGLSQVLLAVSALRWAFYFVLAYAAFAHGGSGRFYLLAAFGGELVLSLGGYFSEFRTVFLVTIFAAVASGLRLTLRVQASLGALVAGLLCFGVVWSSVKVDYRQFVSEGQSQQAVRVDYATRMGKLAELVGSLDAEKLREGADQLFRRMSYVSFLSIVVDYVPRYVEHEDGGLLADAISRPFMPRAFFPEKTVINDSARSSFYTGGVAAESEGTSISLGYIAEAYIDFGYWGMMPALLGIGWAYGLAYRSLFRSKVAGPLLGMGLASFVLLSVGFLDSSITKVAGGFAVSLLVAWLGLKAIRWFPLRWMTQAAPSRRP